MASAAVPPVASTSNGLPQQLTFKALPNLPSSQPMSIMSTAAPFGSAIPPFLQSTALCENCKAHPKYFDGARLHPYCGKTCALMQPQPPTAASLTSNGTNSNNLCTVCKVLPRYNDGKKIHHYCGKTCAAKAKSRKASNASKPGSSQKNGTGSAVSGPLCSIPGCQRAVFTDASGTVSTFCSLKHKKLAEEACLWCKKTPKKVSHFCSRACAQLAQQSSPGLLEVPKGHVTFDSIAEQFRVSWRHTNKACPTVRHVYKIIGTQASLDKYEAYRDKVEVQGQFKSQGRSVGNENRRWHGTKRECSLGDSGQTKFCTSATCSLCNIVKTTFDLSFFKSRTSWGRFGAGIYTSSTSSKSDDYSSNANKSPLKAILLNKVVVGKGCKMTHDNTTLTAPPAGYDSVLAEKGGSLNYDELVVYTNDAIRPSFLVMYDG